MKASLASDDSAVTDLSPQTDSSPRTETKTDLSPSTPGNSSSSPQPKKGTLVARQRPCAGLGAAIISLKQSRIS